MAVMGKALLFRHASDHQDKSRAASHIVHLAALLACGLVFASGVLGLGRAHADTSDGCLAADWIAEARAFVREETGTPVPEVCVRLAKSDRITHQRPARGSSPSSGSRHVSECLRLLGIANLSVLRSSIATGEVERQELARS
jgi:hypothetical protein